MQYRATTRPDRHPPYAEDGSSVSAQEVDSVESESKNWAKNRAAIDVRSLLNGTREATLVLDGEAYRLRITAKEKLILTK